MLFSLILLVACGPGEEKRTTPTTNDTVVRDTTGMPDTATQLPVPGAETYGNRRFRNVVVERTGPDSFHIKGEAQIFEANFSWVIEDGHEELKKGYQMTDAGAPEWGKFTFNIRAQKKRTNSTLTIILFESSAEDGRRMDELPITLY